MRVNGRVAALGDRVVPEDNITVDGKPLRSRPATIYLAYYKPTGIVSTTDEAEPDNIIQAIGYPERIFPVGRLDKYSEGLILLTNDGDIVNKILRAGNAHEKEYLVTVDKPLTDAALQRMRSGIPMLGTVTQPCRVNPAGITTFRIVLQQGLNRQIRRMCEFLGYRVLRLTRIRIMHLTTENLRAGQWRKLSAQEIDLLERSLLHSSKTREASLPRDRRPAAPDRSASQTKKQWKRPR